MSNWPVVDNIKDIITDDCVICLDLDQTCYVSAAGAEKTTIIARHKASGVEKEFKNRKEFWGLTKKTAGGWLKDQNINREAKAKAAGKQFKPWTREDFEIQDVQSPEPIENCLHILKTKIDATVDHFGIKHRMGVLGGDNNFRLRLPAPQQYKSNRADTTRPVHLAATREYVQKHHNAVVVDNIEADDYLTIMSRQGYEHYLKTGKFNFIVATFDKDQFATPGLVFNTYRAPAKKGEKSTWKFPQAFLITDSMGDIWMENGKVKGWGKKFLGYQMLYGDTSDHVRPYQFFDIDFGETRAFSLISPCQTEKEMWEVIMRTYKEWFPNGIEFTSWDGQHIKYTAGQWASVIFQMVYMKQSTTDMTTLSQRLRNVGVI